MLSRFAMSAVGRKVELNLRVVVHSLVWGAQCGDQGLFVDLLHSCERERIDELDSLGVLVRREPTVEEPT